METNQEKYPKSHALLGDVYWELYFFTGASDGSCSELKSAIQYWEKAQELLRNTRVTRKNRTLREELEISIGSARKKIKELSQESNHEKIGEYNE